MRDKSRKRTLVALVAELAQHWTVAVIRRARGVAAVQNGARARDGSVRMEMNEIARMKKVSCRCDGLVFGVA